MSDKLVLRYFTNGKLAVSFLFVILEMVTWITDVLPKLQGVTYDANKLSEWSDRYVGTIETVANRAFVLCRHIESGCDFRALLEISKMER